MIDLLSLLHPFTMLLVTVESIITPFALAAVTVRACLYI